jgi:hypothetical protein
MHFRKKEKAKFCQHCQALIVGKPFSEGQKNGLPVYYCSQACAVWGEWDAKTNPV